MMPRGVETYLPCAVSFGIAGTTLAFAKNSPQFPPN